MKQELFTQQQVADAAQTIAEHNLNPLEELARLTIEAKARGDDMTVESISKFLMPYVYPKQKHVSMDVTDTVAASERFARLQRGRDRVAKMGRTIEHQPELEHEPEEVSFI